TDRYIISSGILVFNVFGLFGNLNVIYAHYRLPVLRTRYGILLTLLCTSQSICLLTELINAIYSLSKIPVIRSSCFLIISLGIFMHCAQTGLMASISVDLFISIVFPLRHRVARTLPYLLLLCLPTLLYAFVVILIAILHMDSTRIHLCNPPYALPPIANQFWYFVALCFGGLTIVTYIISFSTIACKKKSRSVRDSKRSSSGIERKAMKSLSVLLVVFIVTRFLGTVMANVMNLAGVDKETVGMAQSYNVFSAMVCYSSSFYVCFFRSAEYRRIFWYQITKVASRLGRSHKGKEVFLSSQDSRWTSLDSHHRQLLRSTRRLAREGRGIPQGLLCITYRRRSTHSSLDYSLQYQL
ncbi:hypothetical protein PMAYCL1PPCAC_12598, partial [Pristionchus mayeri]